MDQSKTAPQLSSNLVTMLAYAKMATDTKAAYSSKCVGKVLSRVCGLPGAQDLADTVTFVTLAYQEFLRNASYFGAGGTGFSKVMLAPIEGSARILHGRDDESTSVAIGAVYDAMLEHMLQDFRLAFTQGHEELLQKAKAQLTAQGIFAT